MPESIKQILMRRDNLTSEEADRQIDSAREAFYGYLDSADNVCQEYFGLEPDYLDELL